MVFGAACRGFESPRAHFSFLSGSPYHGVAYKVFASIVGLVTAIRTSGKKIRDRLRGRPRGLC